MSLIESQAKLVQLCQQKLPGELALLYGGWSAEREISLMSGKAVLDAFNSAGMPVIAIDVDRQVAERLQAQNVRHVFNVLHGPYGEDGAIGGLLEFMGIGSTGSGVLASALAMDKLRTKQLWRGIGLSTAAFEDVSECVDAEATLARLGGKVMVKPCHEGSSIGMSIAQSAQQLSDAITLAKQYDAKVLAEQYIDGPELSVSIVADEVLPAVELKPQAEFYDYEAKYFSADTQYECPAKLNDKDAARINELASLAYHSLGCADWARVDLMQDASSGEYYVLEVNTIPGMTSHSIVPMAAEAMGVGFPALVLNVLLASLNRAAANTEATT